MKEFLAKGLCLVLVVTAFPFFLFLWVKWMMLVADYVFFGKPMWQ